MKKTLAFVLLTILSSCGSEPKKTQPDWVHESTRSVDNGYIVYIGNGVAMSNERAQFEAEGQALEDLANECSMIPKGTRLEDRYFEKTGHEYLAYVKVGVEFKDCEEMKKTVDPTEIKKLANVSFTQQLKRYQDLIETGEMVAAGENTEVELPSEISPAPPRASGMSENMHFYVVRQYVAYQKEVVVLSPSTAYAANSPESQRFVSSVQPVTQQLQTIETKDSQLRNQPQPWSKLADRPKLQRPNVLAAPKSKWTSPVPHGVGGRKKSAKENLPGSHATGGFQKSKKRRRPLPEGATSH
jgi:hypothetical protein